MNDMKDINYEQSLRSLEQIVEKMESGQLNVDELADNLKKAQTLLKQCQEKLTHTEEQINKLIAD